MCTGVFHALLHACGLALHGSLAFTSVRFKYVKIMPVPQATVDSLEEYVTDFVWGNSPSPKYACE